MQSFNDPEIHVAFDNIVEKVKMLKTRAPFYQGSYE